MTRIRSERGQIVGLTLFFLVGLLGMAGLALDIGVWYAKRQNAQAAADFGALAAASKLPDGSGAVTAGHSYVQKNALGATAIVTPAYGGSTDKVEVRVAAAAPTFFTKLFGVESVDVRTRAVAQRVAGTSPQAIYVHDQSCGSIGFKFNGERMDVDGEIHSNGSFEVNGDNNKAGTATAGGPGACTPKVNGANNSFGGNPMPTMETTARQWPVYFTESEFACDFRATKFTFNADNLTIPPGVYCATQTFEANGNWQTGRITVLAPEIKINGNNQRFTPYAKGVLFFATGTTALDLSLNGYAYNWTGIIFHPRGKVKVNGDQASILNGLIAAMQVEINGGVFRMIGGGGAAKDDILLVE